MQIDIRSECPLAGQWSVLWSNENGNWATTIRINKSGDLEEYLETIDGADWGCSPDRQFFRSPPRECNMLFIQMESDNEL